MFIRFCIKIVPILLICYSYGNITDSVKIYLDSGLLYEKQGNLVLSEQHYKKAIQFTSDNLFSAKIYNNLGILHKKQGKYDLALNYYRKAEQLIHDTLTLVNVYANVSTIYQMKGDFNKAILYNEKALALVKSKKSKSSILNNLGNIFYLMKNYNLALIYYKESIELKRKYNQLKISSGYLNIALCLTALDRNEEAEVYFIKTIAERRKLYGENDYRLIKTFTNYGNFLLERNSKKSFILLSKANDLALLNYGEKHPETAKTYSYLGSYYLAGKYYKKALENYQKALIANSKGFSNMNFYQNPLISESISELQQLEILHYKSIAFNRYANTFKDSQKVLRMSLSTYELAIKTLFKLQNSFMDESKRTLIANKKDMFTEAANVAIQLGDYPKAFQLIEKGKASTLLAAVNNNEAIKFSDIPDSLVGLENEYKRLHFMHSANDNTDSVLFYQAKHDSLIGYFEAKYKKYYNLKHGDEFPDPCEYLDTNQVLLEYALTDTLCISIIVTKEGYKHYSFSVDSTFHNNIEIFINLLKNYTKHDFYKEQYELTTTIGYYLWEKLIKPVNIPDGKSLIIIPDGELSYIPFDALIFEMPDDKYRQYFKLKYLLYKYPVSYSYSARWLFEEHSITAKRKIGAFALDYEEKDSMMILLNTIPIAKNITKYFRGKSFINNKCTKENFLNHAGDFKILHLGMHGDIDKENTENSKLVFSDEILYSWEVYGMKLNTRLAYLSACNTGDGELDRGEGIFSMGRAFAYAGCSSIVSSLWAEKDNIPDITLDFYSYLNKGVSLDIAMQQAKINYITKMDRTQPHYWANKVVIGKTAQMKKLPEMWLFLILFGSVLLIILLKKIISNIF